MIMYFSNFSTGITYPAEFDKNKYFIQDTKKQTDGHLLLLIAHSVHRYLIGQITPGFPLPYNYQDKNVIKIRNRRSTGTDEK